MILVLLLVLNIILLLLRTRKSKAANIGKEDLKELLRELEVHISRENAEGISGIRKDIDTRLRYDADENRKNRTEVSEIMRTNHESLEKVLKDSLSEIREANRKKLEDIRSDINTKLDSSLNERLDSSFKTVGEQLNKLYRSLGELSKLELGVNSLNKTLSNVKTRGIFGEMQLENILTDVLPCSLFDRNVVTKKSQRADNKDAVEYAVKIPDKEINGAFMYLPIDSKFPATYYDRIREASENMDNEALGKAVRDLEQRVKSDAKDIRDKYIDPPNTTDFAVMFLPTESLYAEVLRISGLVEECQTRFHVVITGPSTFAALLNSLSIGFRYMAVNRDSKRILKLLSAIKTQYANLSGLIAIAAKRLDSARKANDDLMKRTELINKRLSSIEEMDIAESEALLGTGASEAEETAADHTDVSGETTEDFLVQEQ